MNIKVNNTSLFSCNICIKNYCSKSSLCNHNKKFHSINNLNFTSNVNNCTSKLTKCTLNIIDTSNKYKCKYCFKNYSSRQNKWNHEQKCKNITKEINELEKIKEVKEVEKIKLQLAKEEKEILQLKISLNNIDNEIDNIIEHEQPINNQLINIIVDKNKTIEELTTKINNNINNEHIIDNKILGKPVIEFHKLTLNDVIIVSRTEDNYINATQLCQAGGKQFKHWYSLESTKHLINEAACEVGIPTSQLVDIKKGNSSEFNQGSWVHPDLAIQLAQWLSPKFALQVSKWIRTLLTDGHVELLKNKDDELKLKNQKIQLLEDTYIKQQKRKNYPTNNVIYVLTTEDHKKNRIYIIGKASNLKNRLGNYNKTAEHEVVYYKNCESEKDMSAIETLVLKKLNKYREKANRDRFILPLENNISLFTNVINECINFFN
jgi:hypothetical protein